MRYPSSLFFLTLSILVQSGIRLYAQLSDTNFENEVIYHVVQRSFYDSNGDMHGDLNGLREKLDYLQDLGVTSILLLPLYHSEYYHNYFATDFETIDPEFGTLEDYFALVRDVHQRGMKIYMDMETQYVTEDHLWYKDSYENPASPYTNYLIYNGPNNTKPESIIFDLTELTGYDGTVRKITTVNLLSPHVLSYNKRLFRFWTDPNSDGNFDDGVDGFRLDHMMDDLDWKGKFTNLFARFWTPLIEHLKEVNPDLIFIAEQANWESYGNEFIEQGNVDRVFAFNLLGAIASFDKQNIARIADSTFSAMTTVNEQIVFLENHDIDRFASVAGMEKLKLGAALNLLLGGLPLIYYGQELGMFGKGGFGMFGNTDANDIPRREAFEWYRTPEGSGMCLWYKDTGPWWDKTNIIPNDGISLEEQHAEENSLWNTYKQLLALRAEHPALVSGSYRTLKNDNTSILTFARESAVQKLVVACNLSNISQEITLDLKQLKLPHKSVAAIYGSGYLESAMTSIHLRIPEYGVSVIELH